ncbi:uncharacterized protein LOC115226123 [Octopus sinensis]|uniref:Uncharacterized protein LOC115226123 n=1 Tax=Octopus sinensis TaxID=2607531 RepID=A0A6P7TLZ4_9MOLL|nr:uncharacterized protein LOC115226123 [Octopus sinensis]
MSGKINSRNSGNVANITSQTVNEKILKECHNLYTQPENGLVKIAEQQLNLPLLAPRKKISILLIGNHSAGKSSFINWYVEEHIQRTGVAIETQGFTFVTSGRKRETLTGNATLHLYPHFEPLRKIHGVTDYLTTEVSTSKQKKFPLVTFIDSPGLVDGDMKYPFDVNKAILWLGDLADLIFVFFDPIGQALCKRTLNIVEKLSEKQADRMRFYLTKADESGHENDRQRVMMQIVQELCKRPGLNRTGFDMPTIFVPSLCARTNRCVNQIEEVCKDIEKTINLTVQNTLNTLEKDCHDIASMIENKLVDDINSRKYNRKAIFHQIILVLFSFALPMFLLLMSNLSEPLFSLAGSSLKETLISYTIPLRTFWNIFTEDFRFYISIGTIVLSLLFLITARFSFRKRTCLSRKQKYVLQEYQDFVKSSVKKKQKLYQEYLKQSIGDHDL